MAGASARKVSPLIDIVRRSPIDFLCPPCEASVATAAVDKRQSGWFADVGLPVTESTRLSDAGDDDEAADVDTYRSVTVAFTPYGIDGKFNYVL